MAILLFSLLFTQKKIMDYTLCFAFFIIEVAISLLLLVLLLLLLLLLVVVVVQ